MDRDKWLERRTVACFANGGKGSQKKGGGSRNRKGKELDILLDALGRKQPSRQVDFSPGRPR